MLRRSDILDLTITDINNEGKGVGRMKDGFVVFIDWSVPGDVVKAEIRKVKRNYAFGKVLQVVKPSELRVQPRCSHFGICNGCRMQNLRYEEQVRIKGEYVRNAFERIGGLEAAKIAPVIGSENIYFYRNKLEYSFSENEYSPSPPPPRRAEGSPSVPCEASRGESFALGYHMPGFVDKVLNIEECYLQSEVSNKVLELTRNFFRAKGASVYSFRTHSGYLRYLIIRTSECTGEVLVNLLTSYEDSIIKEYAERLQREIPEVATLTNSISTAKAQAAIADYYLTLFGRGYIEEEIGRYRFKITPNMFFQTNSRQAKILFDTVLRLAEFEGRERILDLYSGAGAIALYMSEYAGSVIGVESNKEAVEAARENVRLNGVKNCEFAEFDVKDYLKETAAGEFDIIVLDPPRSGLHPKAVECLLELQAKKIIYVSCNPATQARDLKRLAERYDITAVQPVDMFPHTMHIENVAALNYRGTQKQRT